MGFEEERKELVKSLEKNGYIKSESVKKAMLKVKRENFVSSKFIEDAYIDIALPIPGGGSISQPAIHAISLESLKLKPGETFLEIGAGSGIIEAYVSEIFGGKGKVIGTEINKVTYEFGKKNLEKAGYKKVRFILIDGSAGLEEEAPFDRILISAAGPDIPKPLIQQLKPGGKIVAIVGSYQGEQELVSLEKTKEEKIIRNKLLPVVFVPLRGKYGWK